MYGFETTTDEVLADIDLAGKTAVVTGASGGLGEETARALASKGCEVIITARDQTKAQTAADGIKASTGNNDVSVVALELTDYDSVRACAAQISEQLDKLDILINNAGVMACPLQRTADGCEMQFAACHVGHFLLTNLLMPLLEKAPTARVVNLSSGGHKYGGVDFSDLHWQNREYNKWLAYGQAKTANALFTVALDKRVRDKGVRSFAVHPGVIVTDLGRHLTDKDIQDLMEGTRGEVALTMKTIPQGAATSVWAATSPALAESGALYLEDCQIATQVADGEGGNGYYAYALDEQAAESLWSLTEDIVGEKFQ